VHGLDANPVPTHASGVHMQSVYNLINACKQRLSSDCNVRKIIARPKQYPGVFGASTLADHLQHI
jgi:hypothetical protein